MTALLGPGERMWGMQLPIQSQSTIFVAPWETEAGPSELLAVAQAADRAGAGYVAVCDHAAIPAEAAETMGAVWYDTVATLAWLGAQTERVHLLSHVYVVPYRSPLLTAKAFATLDLLTGGRAILGVGAGHVEGEFDLIGADFASRGRAVDDALRVLREVFETGAHGGALVEPRASRASGPPIWVGGSSPPAIRRAATADGWLPQGPPKMGMRAAIECIRAERERAMGGGSAIDLGINCEPVHVGDPTWDLPPYALSGEPGAIAGRLARYVALGVNQWQVRLLARSADELVEQVERFGAEVWPLVEGA